MFDFSSPSAPAESRKPGSAASRAAGAPAGRDIGPDARSGLRRAGERPLIIDSFAGGGGASTGIEMALGRAPDIAINHNPVALAMHAANHPGTLHLSENVYQVDPLDYLFGAHVGFAWFSPDCKHFSKAKGGKPVERNVRDLAWIIPGWVERIQKSGGRVDVVALENVEEFQDWGPLVETDRGLMPDPAKRGQTFAQWLKKLKRLGGKVEWRELRACDYGAPTIRKRLFILIRFDGKKIVWPKPTHFPPDYSASREDSIASRAAAKPRAPAGRGRGRDARSGLRASPEGADYSQATKPWRTAAEIIDWSLPCPSIFDASETIMENFGLRAIRPLADATQSRIARGVKRYVLDAAQPFLVVCNHQGDSFRGQGLDDPLNTITAARDALGIVTPDFASRDVSAARPIGADGQSAAGGKGDGPSRPSPRPAGGPEAREAIVSAPHLMTMRNAQKPFNGVDEPTHTVTAGGAGLSVVSAFMQKYYGAVQSQPVDEPLHTVTGLPRFGFVEALASLPPFTPGMEDRAREVADFLRAHGFWDDREFVTLEVTPKGKPDRASAPMGRPAGATGGAAADASREAITLVMVDIGMRMLVPRELFNAQGFPPDYIIDFDYQGKPLPRSAQVSACGNSVSPPLAAAIAAANCGELRAFREAAE